MESKLEDGRVWLLKGIQDEAPMSLVSDCRLSCDKGAHVQLCPAVDMHCRSSLLLPALSCPAILELGAITLPLSPVTVLAH